MAVHQLHSSGTRTQVFRLINTAAGRISVGILSAALAVSGLTRLAGPKSIGIVIFIDIPAFIASVLLARSIAPKVVVTPTHLVVRTSLGKERTYSRDEVDRLEFRRIRGRMLSRAAIIFRNGSSESLFDVPSGNQQKLVDRVNASLSEAE